MLPRGSHIYNSLIYYSQSAGIWYDTVGQPLVSGCYAGHDPCKNQPQFQMVKNFGPLPQGQYTISPLHTIPHLGPSMALTPAPINEMFSRSGFFVHLDNPIHVGQSSDGCIVAPSYVTLQTIDAMRSAGQDQLTVIAAWPPSSPPSSPDSPPLTT